MRRTTLLTLMALAGFAVAVAAQTPNLGDEAKKASEKNQVQKRTEVQNKVEKSDGAPGARFVDADGDGICDNCSAEGQGSGQGRGGSKGRRGSGPGDGTGNQGVGPADGTGHGGGAQSGNCDGTGPKGKGGRGGRR